MFRNTQLGSVHCINYLKIIKVVYIFKANYASSSQCVEVATLHWDAKAVFGLLVHSGLLWCSPTVYSGSIHASYATVVSFKRYLSALVSSLFISVFPRLLQWVFWIKYLSWDIAYVFPHLNSATKVKITTDVTISEKCIQLMKPYCPNSFYLFHPSRKMDACSRCSKNPKIWKKMNKGFKVFLRYHNHKFGTDNQKTPSCAYAGIILLINWYTGFILIKSVHNKW